MTQTCTQKRYRHPHDSNPQRFRDLPPRFKRQKSTGKSDSEEHKFDNQENKIDNIQAIGASNIQSTTFSSGSSMKQPIQYMSNMPRSRSGFGISEPQLSVNTKMMNSFPTNDQNRRDYAYYHENDTPPMSPWSPASSSQIQNSSIAIDSMTSTRRAEIMSPCLEMAQVANPALCKKVNKLTQNIAGQPSGQAADISDPDIRTIEMLRELERVADLKEREDQERERREREQNGDSKDASDRKNYVSHHLRMLMCAVDRYTADIDEEDDSLPAPNQKENYSKARSKPTINVHSYQGDTKNAMKKESVQPINNSINSSSNQAQYWHGMNFQTQPTPGMIPTCPPYGFNTAMTSVQPPPPLPQQMQLIPAMIPVPTVGATQYLAGPPMMQHMLTPPPSRTSSPHLSPVASLANLSAPHGASMYTKAGTISTGSASKALIFGEQNGMKPQDSFAHMIAAPGACAQPPERQMHGDNCFDLWASPTFNSFNAPVNSQRERKPLYNR